jgi:hypothetical protein
LFHVITSLPRGMNRILQNTDLESYCLWIVVCVVPRAGLGDIKKNVYLLLGIEPKVSSHVINSQTILLTQLSWSLMPLMCYNYYEDNKTCQYKDIKSFFLMFC